MNGSLSRKEEDREVPASSRPVIGQVFDPNLTVSSILENMRDCFFLLDSEWRFVFVNSQTAAFFGIPEERMIGGKFTEVLPLEPGHEILARFQWTLDENTPQRFETISPTSNQWAEIDVYPVNGGLAIYFRDISERKQAEEALRKSEEKYRTVLTSIDEGFCILEVILDDAGNPYDLRLLEGNPALYKHTNLPEIGIGKTAREVLPEVDPEWLERFGDVALTGKQARFEIEVRSGFLKGWYSTYVLRVEAPELHRLAIFFRNITEAKEAEQALRHSEECLRLAAESANMHWWEIDLATRTIEWSPNARHSLISPMPSTIDEVWPIIDPPDREKVMRAFQTAINSRGMVDVEFQIAGRLPGTEIWVCSTGVALPGDDGSVDRIVGVTQNISKRKRAEQALRRAREELEQRVLERTQELAHTNEVLQTEVQERIAAAKQVRRLLRRLVNLQEIERRRIARDIHDHMGQQMTALRMNLASLRAGTLKYPGLEEQVERTLDLAEELDRSVDFLVWELRPASLDHLGLSPALRALVNGWAERSNIRPTYHATNVEGVRFTSDVENNLYHLAQEALHNAYKHSGADNVSVFFEFREGKATLIIEDDGRGFNLDTLPEESETGMGLVSMRERTALIGGTVEIESSPGAGTTIYVRVPAKPVKR